ncbi:hypothetical protein ACTJJZ_15000, partial [Microbacterium sp. 22242]
MASFDAIAALIPTLSGRIGAGASAEDALDVIVGLDDEQAVAAFAETVELGSLVEHLQLIEAGVIRARSSWQAGHAGLAQRLGHRSAATLVQELGGMSKAEAARQVRVGEALLEEAGAPADGTAAGEAAGSEGSGLGATEGDAGPDPGDGDAGCGGAPSDAWLSGDESAPWPGDGQGDAGPRPDPVLPWFEPLRAALRARRLTSAQFDAIRRGLGEPPGGCEAAWSAAAEQLVDEATQRTVEELLAHARCVRDLLDPVGAEERARVRYERRAFRTWLDPEGARRGSMVFDDEGGAFFDTVFAAALR